MHWPPAAAADGHHPAPALLPISPAEDQGGSTATAKGSYVWWLATPASSQQHCGPAATPPPCSPSEGHAGRCRQQPRPPVSRVWRGTVGLAGHPGDVWGLWGCCDLVCNPDRFLMIFIYLHFYGFDDCVCIWSQPSPHTLGERSPSWHHGATKVLYHFLQPLQ